MAVEIRQLLVKTNLSAPSPAKEEASEPVEKEGLVLSQKQMEEILKECAKLVRQILDEDKER